ncbi:MAG: M20/M25/M40 family metallo-hydrolase [Pseudomonadota bacterium]
MKRTGAFTTGVMVAVLLALSACTRAPLGTVPMAERDAIHASLMQDIRTLASDEFGGRRPGTMGEELTLAYITQELQAAGFTSGTNDPGNAWRAPVPLVSTQPATSRIALKLGRREVTLDEAGAAAFTSRRRALVEGADIVFVGTLSDVVPDEAVGGKVVLMLGEPGESPERRLALFEKNPAAIITVVADEQAIANTLSAFDNERFLLASEEISNLSGFATRAEMARALGEERWEGLLTAADDDEFEPLEVKGEATIEATSIRREFTSYNLIGVLPGGVRGSGAVLLLAHWDHLGECGEHGAADLICNGAIDNASGVAVVLELARRLAAIGPHDRDIYVLATSAEESGLLGAKAFVDEPPMPLDTIVAAFNFDTVALAPAGSPVGFVGEGLTPLDTLIRETMIEGERQLGNKELAERFVQRQDGWALLERGVPTVMLSTAFGSEIILGPYLSSHYHRPSDEIDKVELGGAIDDLLLHQELVQRAADTEFYPATGG